MGRLENKVNKEELKQRLAQEKIQRTTLSFYKYAQIEDVPLFREHFYKILSEIGTFGRIYVSSEGVNGQLSIPTVKLDTLRSVMDSIPFLKNIRLNIAIDDDGKSFYKLTIKERKKILADGLNDQSFDVTDRGEHLSAEEFNQLSEQDDSIIIDMRNHYESEVGHFDGAITPDVETFRDSLPIIEDMLDEHRDKHIIMYCTGGIRCEKASAYYKHKGFKNVYQLDGGIIEYARQVKNQKLENKFKGKNFVFDERLGERITEEIISKCHQCGRPCDTHVNCNNETCHILFIQCDSCAAKNNNCCSTKCKDFAALPIEEQDRLKPTMQFNGTKFGKGRYKAARIEDNLEDI